MDGYKKMESENKYLTVSQFTNILKTDLENRFTTVFLTGEISNFKESSTGHWYFSLKDMNATIKVVVFKFKQSAIIRNLTESLKNGMEVLVEGSLSLYAKGGDYSIDATKIILSGIGELYIKFEKLKKKLSEKGYFDTSRKKPIPKMIEKIGIVTSPTTAALQDILNVLKRRHSNLEIIVFPTPVQGDDAKNSIVRAIECANFHYLHNTDKSVPLLIVARGGGSIEDLWAFNEEIVADAIYKSEIPIITGVGHEIDFTIADFVADFRAPTPSAAAEIVSVDKEELKRNINFYNQKIEKAISQKINTFQEIIDRNNKDKLALKLTRLNNEKYVNFSYIFERLNSNFEKKILNAKSNFEVVIDKLNILNPMNILKRGYNILINKDGNVVKEETPINVGDNATLVMSNKKLAVSINKIDFTKII